MALCSAYTTVPDLISCGCPENAAPDVLELAIDSASEILYGLTGRQYPGTCEASLRPCGTPSPRLSGWSFPWIPMKFGETWLNVGGCGCQPQACGCSTYHALNLGRSDIQSVDEVTIDGEVMDEADYRLDSNRYLVRTDGGRWPCCQNLSLDSGEGTFIIDVTYGRPLPQSLRMAAAELAAELVKACVGDASCALPATTQTIVRQGVTMELFDPAEILSTSSTGLYRVDLVIQSLNPAHLARGPRVWSPDLPAAVWS